ncbi:MAG: hypothetical protein AAGA70_08185 [Pseudomonadota bacterium]
MTIGVLDIADTRRVMVYAESNLNTYFMGVLGYRALSPLATAIA